jgi:hypothetical protein
MCKLLMVGTLLITLGTAGALCAQQSDQGRVPTRPVVEASSEERLEAASIERTSVSSASEAKTDAVPAVQASLPAIVQWLSSEFDLPESTEHPRVEFATVPKMVEVRFGALVSSKQMRGIAEISDARLLDYMRDTMALYENATRTIYLRDGWNAENPTDLSVLVHEMVHHLQNVADIKYECAQAREKLAYAAQQKWLASRGLDFFREFETDPISLMMRTVCVF